MPRIRLNVRQPGMAFGLAIALLGTLLAPLRAGWACPDGTPCAGDSAHGFVCVGGQCAGPGSCCTSEQPVLCKHGAVPEFDPPRTPGASVQAPDHCRFGVRSLARPIAVVEPGGQLRLLSVDLLPAPEPAGCRRSRVRMNWEHARAPECRPPPSHSTGPARAPPTL